MIPKTENIREIAKKKLHYFITNPGYFSILILGDGGAGKTYLLNQVLTAIDKSKIGYYYPYQMGETEEEIAKIFETEYIIIRNIDELTHKQQNIILKALATFDGTIGLQPNRGFKRIVFISSFDITQLTGGSKHLLDKFWDRISQLVLKIPSFKDFSSEIRNDFKSVWDKMSFEEYPKLPEDAEFITWLGENCKTFSGNFRDLYKLAILWHQYRIIEYDGAKQRFKSDVETRVFRKVRADFEQLNHFPTQKADTTNTFEIKKGKTWEQIERDFQAQFKAWAKINFSSLKEATKELNMPLRKMDKW